ncbi:hypothetical protein [Geodermatophilus amargosae]|uniref:hypothetical protein n=1 Tax=Geodermatophilus amargosae TaxID=1296565 RepID=UPI0034DF3CCC
MHPTPRPAWWAPWRVAWWVVLLAVVAVVLFGVAFAVRLSCGLGDCAAPAVRRLLSLDAVGGLPRLFTTGVLAAAGVLAGVRGWCARGRLRHWWAGVAGTALVLAVLKLESAHSAVESGTSPVTTLVLGVAIAVPALALLTGAGRAWGVAEAIRVVSAFAAYALAAVGLDAVTALVAALQDDAGTVSRSSAAFVEELGEALAAVVALAVVRAATEVSRTGR